MKRETRGAARTCAAVRGTLLSAAALALAATCVCLPAGGQVQVARAETDALRVSTAGYGSEKDVDFVLDPNALSLDRAGFSTTNAGEEPPDGGGVGFCFTGDDVRIADLGGATMTQMRRGAVILRGRAEPTESARAIPGEFALTWKNAASDAHGKSYDVAMRVSNVSYCNPTGMALDDGIAILQGPCAEPVSASPAEGLPAAPGADDGDAAADDGAKISACAWICDLAGEDGRGHRNIEKLREGLSAGRPGGIGDARVGVSMDACVSVVDPVTGKPVGGGTLGMGFRDIDQPGIGSVGTCASEGDDFGERVVPESGFSAGMVHVSEDTCLRGDRSGSVLEDGGLASALLGTRATATGESELSGFTAKVDASGFSYGWAGAACATPLFATAGPDSPKGDAVADGSKGLGEEVASADSEGESDPVSRSGKAEGSDGDAAVQSAGDGAEAAGASGKASSRRARKTAVHVKGGAERAPAPSASSVAMPLAGGGCLWPLAAVAGSAAVAGGAVLLVRRRRSS